MESVWAQYLHARPEYYCLSRQVLTVSSSSSGGIVMCEEILRSDMTCDVLTIALFRRRDAFSTKDVIAEFGCCSTDSYYASAPLSVYINGVSIL